jgi:signal transduction histidine kinase
VDDTRSHSVRMPAPSFAKQTVVEPGWSRRIDEAIELLRDDAVAVRAVADELLAWGARDGPTWAQLYGEVLHELVRQFADEPSPIEPLLELRARFARLGDWRGEALAAFCQLSTYRSLGLTESVYRFTVDDLLPLAARVDEPSSTRLLVVNSCGIAAVEWNRVDEAIRHFHAALDDARTLGLVPRATHISANIGELLTMCGNAQEGEAVLEAALAQARGLARPWVAVFVSILLTLCKLELGKPREALAVIEPYIEPLRSNWGESLTTQVFFYATAAYALAENGQIERAEPLAEQAVALAEGKLQERQLRPYAWWARGHLRHLRGELEAAIADLQTAVRETGEVGYVFMPMRATAELADIHAERGDWRAAYAALTHHHRLYDKVQHQASRTKLQLLRAEFALHESERDVRRQRELTEMKTRFLAMASHEFRTPLAAIQSAAEVLEHYHERLPEDERRAVLMDIRQAVGRLKTTMEQVLTLSRADAGKLGFNPAPLAPLELCRRVIAEVVPALAGRNPIDFAAQGEGWEEAHVLADEILLGQAIGNLLSNAAKYSPPAAPVTMRLRRGDEGWEVEVSDRGIGIPQTDLPLLFESFQRASNTGTIQGTGLGLAIVKRAVEAHGGRVSVKSAIGRGSSFTLHLPWVAGGSGFV